MEANQKTDQAKTACGGTPKDTKGYPSAVYHGERIYFCAPACLRAFEQEPGPLYEWGDRAPGDQRLRFHQTYES